MRPTSATKIGRLIRHCKYGIHDISRVEIDLVSGLPRLNMAYTGEPTSKLFARVSPPTTTGSKPASRKRVASGTAQRLALSLGHATAPGKPRASVIKMME